MTVSTALALVNAGLTTIALGAASAGYRAIRRGEVLRHRACMLSAVLASALFLGCFVYRYVVYGVAEFNGRGVARLGYLALLVSHEVLAVSVVPLVLATAALGLASRRAAHRELARMALPIWAYVMITGLVICFLLYVWPGRP